MICFEVNCGFSGDLLVSFVFCCHSTVLLIHIQGDCHHLFVNLTLRVDLDAIQQLALIMGLLWERLYFIG